MEGDRIAKSLGIYEEKYSKSRTKSVDFAGEDDVSHLQSGATGCKKGFVDFSETSLPSLGSTAAAAQPNGQWNYQTTFYKTFFTT